MILTPLCSMFGFCFHKALFLYSFFKTFFFGSSLLCCRKTLGREVIQTVKQLFSTSKRLNLFMVILQSSSYRPTALKNRNMHIIENYSDPFFPVYTVGSSCNRKYHCEHIKIVPEYLWDSMLHLKSLLYAATGLHNATEKKSQVP